MKLFERSDIMPQNMPPSSPPPTARPRRTGNSYIVDCLYSYTYVWPKFGRPFWYYPTRVERHIVSGYRWTGRQWIFYGFDPRIIDEVACYPVPTPY